jgi:hypothetical protein
VEEWRSGTRPWFLTWGIVYEFLRVSTHAQVFPNPLEFGASVSFVFRLLDSPGCGVLIETERHSEVLVELSQAYPRLAGNLVHDFHIAALMKEHGVTEIRTADTDFHQFAFLRVVNPLAAS